MAERKKKQPVLTNRTCKQITDLLFDFINERLRPAVRRDFEQHLRVCPDCISFLNTYKKTVALTGSLRATELPPEMQRNMLEFLRRRSRIRS